MNPTATVASRCARNRQKRSCAQRLSQFRSGLDGPSRKPNTPATNSMKAISLFLFVAQIALSALAADPFESKPDDPYFAKFNPARPPRPAGPLLKKGDRLAICGDSITEQKMYSRIMETYLTVCQPELNVSVRQFGWSGEQTPGFLAR